MSGYGLLVILRRLGDLGLKQKMYKMGLQYFVIQEAKNLSKTNESCQKGTEINMQDLSLNKGGSI